MRLRGAQAASFRAALNLRLGAIVAAVLALSWPSIAAAQNQVFGPFLDSSIPLDIDRGRNVSVLDRERPEYEPIGIDLGGFTMFPRAQVGAGFSDNVFGSRSNQRSDAFFTFDPELTFKSKWSRNALNVSGGGAFRRFATQTLKNESGLFARADGRYDISEDTTLFGAAQIRRAYEAQYSGSFPANALQSVEFVQKIALARIARQAGQFRLTGAADVNNFNFRDLAATTGGTIDQDFRDRTVVRGAGRVEYAFTPEAAVFVEASGSRIGYDKRLATFGDNRDGAQYQLLAGTTFDLTALVRARIGVGYLSRDFDSARFRPISGFAYDARLEYFLSGLTTVTAGATRTIEESITTGSSGYVSNTALARIDHELLRNLLLFGQGQYQHNTFEGISRRDDLWLGSAGGTYIASNRWSVSGTAQYIDRGSGGSSAGQVFNEWRLTAAITFTR